MNTLKKITTTRTLSSLESIELAVEDVCLTLDIKGSHANFITLAISELASNMIIHGGGSVKSPDNLTVKIYSSRASVTVVMEDGCEPLPVAVVKRLEENSGVVSEYDTTISNLPESGWGLDLISSAASSVSYQRKNQKNIYELAFERMVS